jgi:pimeloyl-ACP methyl ester carboxylesterase
LLEIPDIPLYTQFWKAYVKRPMVLVGPSLGGAVAIDFALAHPDAVSDFSPLPDLATFLHLAPHMVLYCMEVLYVS